MYNLGVLAYEDGDQDTARTWFQRAADLGHADAMYNLGALAEGKGDEDSARTWFRRAADLGHTHARRALRSLG